jgi:hypothetical protein
MISRDIISSAWHAAVLVGAHLGGPTGRENGKSD